MKQSPVHNLDTLEREILRLRLKAKATEEELEKNMDYLQENYPAMLFHSFTNTKKEQASKKHTLLESLLKNEHLSTAINKISEHIANKASVHIENLVDKLFKKKE